jgi:hypothetical protein
MVMTLFFGGRGNDLIVGGTGAGRYVGGLGDDRFLIDANPRDTVIGGEGEDGFVMILDFFDILGSGDIATRRKAFNLQRKAVENRQIDADDGVALATTAQGDGRHVIVEQLEYVQFAQTVSDFLSGRIVGELPLAKVAIIIDRNADGTARGTVMVDGKEDGALSAFLRDDGAGGMWFDTLTPIGAGSYAAHYRISSVLGQVIALSGWDDDLGKLKQTAGLARGDSADLYREAILLHSGARNGLSEGCFLTGPKAGGFIDAAFEKLAALYADDFARLAVDKVYFPVIPVTIDVRNDVPQPKIRGLDRGPVTPEDDGQTPALLTFDVVNDGAGIREKALNVFFTVSGSARLGQDWTFANLGEKPAIGGHQHGALWLEGMMGTSAVYGVRIGVKNGVLRSSVDIPVNLEPNRAGELQEAIRFNMVDIDLLRLAGDGNWRRYAISGDSDIDGRPNAAERLLFHADPVATLLIAPGPEAAASDVWM